MLGGRQTIFLTPYFPYFQFEKRFDFMFVYVMNTCDYFLCLPSWHHGKGVNCDGKSWKSHGILLSVFCGNPVHNVRVGTIHRCIDISRYLSRDSYRDTLGNNFDLKKKCCGIRARAA